MLPMTRPSRIALILACAYALHAAINMTAWWTARLGYTAPGGTREMFAAFLPALPWYFLGVDFLRVAFASRGKHAGIEMTAWLVGIAINATLIFALVRYVGRHLRISWVRAA